MKTEIREVDPRSIKLLDVNARYMPYEQYQQLVANVKRDGVLSSVPFCWTLPDGTLEVGSGNHRVQAAVDAGLPSIHVIVTADDLTEPQKVAIQLSHNSIAGVDDPAVLKQLYDSITDVELREYAGLDDKTLDLLAHVDIGSLSEANLDFASVQIMFLPAELDVAKEALADARKLIHADETWMAARQDHDRLLDALEETQASYKVGNVATALHVILSIYEANRRDLTAGYINPEGEPRHTGWVPTSTLFGRSSIPAAAAVVIDRAVKAMIGREEIPADKPWQALEYWAADYLAGPVDTSNLAEPTEPTEEPGPWDGEVPEPPSADVVEFKPPSKRKRGRE